MIMQRVISMKSIKWTKTCLAISFVLLYIVGSVNVELIHKLKHAHHQNVSHTIKDESDACHVSIYHQGKQGGCEHKQHLVKNTKCSLCDSQLHKPHLLSNLRIVVEHVSFSCNLSLTTSNTVNGFFCYTQDRAPPVL